MNKIILFFCISTIFIGCKDNKYNLNQNIATYNVNIEERQKISVFDLFSDIQVIPLETNKESLIAWGLPQIYKDNIYILEDRRNIILCFDTEGKWLFNINNIGRGAQEYQSLQSLSFDRKNDYLLLHEFFGPIHEYTLNGEFIHKYNCKDLPVTHYLEAINRDTLMLYDMHNNPKIHFYSRRENKVIKSLYKENKLVNSSPLFYFYNDSLYFLSSCYGNTTYNLSDTKQEPAFHWDFGKYNYNVANIHIPNMTEKQWQGKVEIEWRQKNCPYVFAQEFENKQYVYLSLILNYTGNISQGIQPQWVNIFYNKTTHKYHIFDDFKEKIDWGVIFEMDDDYVYCKTNNYTKNLILQSHILSSEEQQKLLNMKDDDNYAIIRFKFKK